MVISLCHDHDDLMDRRRHVIYMNVAPSSSLCSTSLLVIRMGSFATMNLIVEH